METRTLLDREGTPRVSLPRSYVQTLGLELGDRIGIELREEDDEIAIFAVEVERRD